MLEIAVSALLLIGAFFVLLGSFALVKLPDFYTRLHGPTKATTLGLGSLVLASMLFFMVGLEQMNWQPLLIAIFLFISAPITAHMLIKLALYQQLPVMDKTKNQQWRDEMRAILKPQKGKNEQE